MPPRRAADVRGPFMSIPARWYFDIASPFASKLQLPP
jgi:hypothetical protein